MSALVRRIRRLILSGGSNQELQEAIGELGLTAGEPTRGSLQKLQRIILNDGRDSEVQLRRALNGIGITGGDAGGRERVRIRDALLKTGRVGELREAIDTLITLEAGTPEWLEVFRAPNDDLPLAAALLTSSDGWLSDDEAEMATLFSGFGDGSAVTAQGLQAVDGASTPGLSASFKAALTPNDCCLLIVFTTAVSVSDYTYIMAIQDTDGADVEAAFVEIVIDNGTVYATPSLGDFNSVGSVSPSTSYRLAINFYPNGDIEASLDGATAVTSTLAGSDLAAWDHVFLSHRNGNPDTIPLQASDILEGRITALAAYPRLSTADLEELAT